MKTTIKGATRHHVRRLGLAVYHGLPPGWRNSVVDFSFRNAAPVFRGYRHYQLWSGAQRDESLPAPVPGAVRLLDIEPVVPQGVPPGRIAVHAHVYYEDLAQEMAGYLRNMPFAYDLYVSVTNEAGQRAAERAFRRLPKREKLDIRRVPNRGRDLAPMLCTFGQDLRGYDVFAHIHTKKSLYNKGATAGWREYLFDGLFGDRLRLRKIFHLLTHSAAIVYPQAFHRVPYAGCSWMANRPHGKALCERLGVEHMPPGYFDFPVGSVFWARMDALRPLFDAGITLEEFDVEAGQNDGTFAHAIERMLGILARESGRELAILRDAVHPSWSRWRFAQYLHRRPEASEGFVSEPEVRLVAFDIFDTLLTRPLIDPEQTKAIVTRRLGPELGEAYGRWRVEAERQAREAAGRDIGMPAIAEALARLSGRDAGEVQRMLETEIAVELASVAPRPDAAAVFDAALAHGKRVVLASDMFLPRQTLEAMLERHGFTGWQALYLSSEIGLRKDSGALYDHMLEVEGLQPDECVMVGDNERSDLQIPGDRGWRFLHVLRPTELARAMPRLAPLVEDVERAGDVDAHLGLGLVVRRMFGRWHHSDGFDAASLVPKPNARNLGYALVGPLVFAFTQWLLDQAREGRVARCYFLSREGQFLKMVYDRLAAGEREAPTAHYLVVSRRALNVATIRGMDEVLPIARANYGPASLETFLYERFGLELGADARQALADAGLWENGRELEIVDGELGGLEAVLEALLPAILEQGELERPALMAYLASQGMNEPGRQAVVDVGFSGTIQKGLNLLLGGGVDGYYMATLEAAGRVAAQFGVEASGAFHHMAPPDAVPAFVIKGFALEKFLSSDDTQLMHYRLGDEGDPQPVFRPPAYAEKAAVPVRNAIRAGALAFVEDAMAAQRDLLPDFRFPLELAARLFESFVTHLSPQEARTLGGVVLDDHYCGRGLVS